MGVTEESPNLSALCAFSRRFDVRHSTPRALALVISGGIAASTGNAQWYQGPSGPGFGSQFDNWAASGHSLDIRGVTVFTYSDNSIACVLTTYPTGVARSSSNCGSNQGTPSDFALASDEYVLGVSGQYSRNTGAPGGTGHITQLRFYTNKRNSPVYGAGGGRTFGYTAPQGQMIVALIGDGGPLLYSIGVMYAHCTPATKQCK
jgi:Jacalin-like lectin domain.